MSMQPETVGLDHSDGAEGKSITWIVTDDISTYFIKFSLLSLWSFVEEFFKAFYQSVFTMGLSSFPPSLLKVGTFWTHKTIANAGT